MTSKSKLRSFIFILISVSIILFPVIAHALTFQYSKPITIDHTKVPATLTNFPALVSIANDNDLKNHVTSPSGYDLVFADAAGNPLDHEIESWDGGTGTIVAWVRIPSLSSTTDTVIYAWYGSSEVTSSLENKTGVWDSNFKGVWHLGNGSTLTTNDSTSNGNNGTNNGATAGAGQVDGGASLDGANDYISVPNSSSLQPTGDFTITAWINPAKTENWQGIVFKSYIGGGYRFAFALSPRIFFFVQSISHWNFASLYFGFFSE